MIAPRGREEGAAGRPARRARPDHGRAARRGVAAAPRRRAPAGRDPHRARSLVTDEQIAALLAERAGLPLRRRLRKGLVDPRMVDVIPPEKARRYTVLPLFRCTRRSRSRSATPPDASCSTPAQAHRLRDPAGRVPRRGHPAHDRGDLRGRRERGRDPRLRRRARRRRHRARGSTETAGRFEDIAEMAGESPIINLVNQVLLEGDQGARQRHPHRARAEVLRIRFRIDGVLYEVMRQRADLHAPIVSRLKIMANLDIAERRLPQDGRIQVLAQGRTVDLRFSSLPGVLGEKVVLRVLDREIRRARPGRARASRPRRSTRFRSLLHRPHGLVLVTGPTGSGKTTTLYAALRELNSHREEHRDDRGPGRVPARDHLPEPGARGHRAHLRPRCSSTPCARTRTSSWSARSATPRRPRSPCRRR